MKYEKNQYTDGASICGFIMGGIFLAWGVNWMVGAGFPLFIPGIVFLCIGIAIIVSQIRALRNRDKIKNIIKEEFRANPDASVDEIKERTGFTKKDIQAVILDLKAEGQLRGKFSSKTGKLKEAPKPEPQAQEVTKAQYCPNCGTPVKDSQAKFCQFCGASV